MVFFSFISSLYSLKIQILTEDSVIISWYLMSIHCGSSSWTLPDIGAFCPAPAVAPGSLHWVRCSCWHWCLWWPLLGSCAHGSSGRPGQGWTSGSGPWHSGQTLYLQNRKSIYCDAVSCKTIIGEICIQIIYFSNSINITNQCLKSWLELVYLSKCNKCWFYYNLIYQWFNAPSTKDTNRTPTVECIQNLMNLI